MYGVTFVGARKQIENQLTDRVQIDEELVLIFIYFPPLPSFVLLLFTHLVTTTTIIIIVLGC